MKSPSGLGQSLSTACWPPLAKKPGFRFISLLSPGHLGGLEDLGGGGVALTTLGGAGGFLAAIC